MKDQPYFCVLEFTEEGYYHAHQMIVTDKRSAKWLSWTYKLKDLVRTNPNLESSQTRLPNADAHHCLAPKRISPIEIMTNYVTFSTKGKNIGSGDIRLDPLGPKSIRPVLDKPAPPPNMSENQYVDKRWWVTNFPLWEQWKTFERSLTAWNELKFKLEVAKRYKREYAFILSEPSHPHHKFHKAQLALKEQFVADLITRETTK